MNSSFPNRWSFSYLKFTKYVTNIIAEPKYKYGQQEQVTLRNHNRSTALERSVLKFWGSYGNPTSPSASVMAQNIQLFGPREVFWLINGSSWETNKSQINTIMKQRWDHDRNMLRPASGNPSDVEQYHWNTRAKENQQLNPVGQTTDKKSPAPTN